MDHNHNPNEPYFIEFPCIGNSELGFISVAEPVLNVPFEIKRVYWTYFTPQDVQRGAHSHRRLKQIIFAVSGTINFQTEDQKGEKMEFVLNKPNLGLYVPPGVWRTISFSDSAVLLCLASDLYTEDDYIRQYDEFISVRGRS